jgi:diacylglycerol kinase (ATP)
MDHPLSVEPFATHPAALGNPFAQRYLVVLNPAAGQRDTERVLRLLAAAFASRRVGFDVVETAGAGDAERFARAAVETGYRCVVAVGGDGTVGEIITALAGTDVPLGIIPKGTGNQVAYNLGLPRTVEEAVEVVVNGVAAPIDLGQVDGGRHFAMAVGTGWDTAMMSIATRELKDRWGFGAYIYAFMQLGRTRPTQLYRITADGESAEVHAAMVVVANMGVIVSNPPALKLTLGPNVSHRDGKLDVCVFAPRTLGDVAGLLWSMTRTRFAGDDRMLFFQASEVRLETDPPTLYEMDGELVGQTPLVARAVPGAVRVLVPRR